MIIIRSKNNIPIRLTTERWKHIIKRHPEMDSQKERVLKAVSDPHMIQQGDFGELMAIKFHRKTPLTSKYLVAVYKEVTDDGFILTAYYTDKPSERRQILWKR